MYWIPEDLVEKFQSTPSVWRVTKYSGYKVNQSAISIHTLRVEGDISSVDKVCVRDISIHTLRVEGDELSRKYVKDFHDISIHTLRVEGDAVADFVDF